MINNSMHNRLEHIRPLLVKFPLSRSFGICKATALLHPAITAEQKFFGAWVCEFKKSKFFARKGKSAVNSLSINEHFNALLRKICLFGPHVFESVMPIQQGYLRFFKNYNINSRFSLVK